jgi:hypothetical protein
LKKAVNKSPVRRALRQDSNLLGKVSDGLDAMQSAHRAYLDATIRSTFADSLDLDDAVRPSHPQENRWDYLLGHGPSGEVVGLEPHSAKHDEITTVINKRAAAQQQLKGHLREGARVSKWLWVASGKVHFADTEKAKRQLDQSGIEFVGKMVMVKHLPVPGTGLHAKKRRVGQQ